MASTNPKISSPTHCVAVIGGATAGAEVAGRLAERGAQVAVFEMNPRPYGKIEDGLPRWHHALRNKEYETVRGKLGRAGVHYVPNSKIGVDVDFDALVKDWGFSSVVLANGAWRDRPLPIDGVDDYIDKGLIYQNPFIIGFNHRGEKDFTGQTFASEDGAIVVGGGLASIDVAKVLMLETAQARLAERGIEVSILDLEVKGIPKICEKNGLKYEDLGIQGCTIYYRRRIEDMPLMDAPEGADAARIAKVEKGRRRMADKAMDKFGFRIEPLSSPVGMIVEDGKLVGLRFCRNEMVDGRPKATDETFEARGTYIISSIGSIPEGIPGIPMRGELFDFQDWDLGLLDGYPTLFSVGNVVTGKGNIVASRKHAAHVSEIAIERFLGIGEGDRAAEAELAGGAAAAIAEEAEEVTSEILAQAPLSADAANAVLERVAERQRAVGYDGDFAGWIARNTPPDLE